MSLETGESSTATAAPAAPQGSEVEKAIDDFFGGGEPAPAPAPAARATPAPALAPVAKPAAPAANAPEPATPAKEPTQDRFSGDVPKPKEKPAPKPAQPATPAQAAAKTPEEFKTPKELREAYERVRGEREQADREIQTLRSQISEAKRAGETEAEARLKRDMEGLKKERDELDQKVRFTDYSASAEYKEKYLKPLTDVWMEVNKELEGVKITTEDGDIDATQEHMFALLRMPGIQAAKKAKEWFGDASPEIIAYRRQLVGLYKSRDEALNTWRTKGSEMAAEQKRQTEEGGRARVTKFDSEMKTYRESYPDVYVANAEDAEEKTYFEKGSSIVDLAFRGEGLEPGLTPEQRTESIVRAQANVAAKAANFGVLVHRLRKAQDEIEKLKTDLSAYQGSEPGNGDGGRGSGSAASQATEKSAEQLIDEA